jgi:CubicO group peptidase (beta-lactamase class C family)
MRVSATARIAIFAAAFSPLLATCCSGQSSTPAKTEDPSPRIQRIATKVIDLQLAPGEQPIRLNLAELMDLYKVPGLSIAVIDNFQIAWAQAYGVIGADSKAPITTKTLFQAGSISKPVAATGALYLVQQGKLSLDEDVNDKLKTWKIPENEFTKTEKVTLRRLLSHTGGLTVHGFPGYDLDEPVPTLVQIFNGEKPANTAPIRVDIVPGTEERYSGGGITIEQQLMIDVTGEPFPAFMRETVLDKIGMHDSSYEQPLPATRSTMAAHGTHADGKPVRGNWHIYPEMAAAGLWTTPTDLARFAIEIALSQQDKANHVLSRKMTREMLTPVFGESGLGLFLDKRNPGQFGHNGDDEGFQAMLTMNATTGKGLAIMANSQNGIAVGGLLMRSVAKEYGWNYKFEENGMADLYMTASLKDANTALHLYDQKKKEGNIDTQHEEAVFNQVGYMLLTSGRDSDAVLVFQRNVQNYPQSSNVYDSLGEAYVKVGKKDLAIRNYEKSLELNPKNTNATKKLEELRQMK